MAAWISCSMSVPEKSITADILEYVPNGFLELGARFPCSFLADAFVPCCDHVIGTEVDGHCSAKNSRADGHFICCRMQSPEQDVKCHI
jgi:hypothetical protein